jgi:hypothetical protein
VRRRGFAAAAIFTGLIVLVGGAVVQERTIGSSRISEQVAVFESHDDTDPTYFATARQAESRAAEVAGFEPLVPGYLPTGYRITLIGVDSSRGSTLRRVEVVGPGDGEGFKLLVANEPFGFAGDEAENAMERPSPNSRLYRHADGEFGPSFTLITESRGIYASSPPGGVSPDELRKVLLSYPLD